jgi:hypothetical protein
MAVILGLSLLALSAPAARADWSAPELLADSSVARYSPAVAANPSGDAVVLWTHWYDEYTTSVETSWRTGSGAWTPWTTLSGEIEYLAGGGGNVTIQPTVAINDAGEAAAAWTKGNAGSGHDLYVAIKPRGRPFQTPVMLSGPELKTVFYPSVGVDADGDVLALWEDMDDYSIYFAEAPHGGTFGPPQTISAPNKAGVATYPSMALSANGEVAISWSDRHHSYLQVRRADGTLEPAIDVSQSSDCWTPHAAYVTADAHGDFLASWGVNNGYECRNVVARYNWRAAGAPMFGATRELNLPSGYAGGWGNAALSRDGRATWVFGWDRPDSAPLAAADASLLGDFGTPVDIGPQTGGNPQVTFDEKGDTYVGWWDWANGIGELAHSITRTVEGDWEPPVAMTTTGSAGLFLAGMRDSALAAFEDPWGIEVRTSGGQQAPAVPVPPSTSRPSGAAVQPAAIAVQVTPERSGPQVRELTFHVRVPTRGTLHARLVRGRHRYATASCAVRRPGVATVGFPGHVAPGRYTVQLAITVRHRTIELRSRRLTVPR